MPRSRSTALITGASGGIGYELAKLFARDGCGLVLVARDRAALEGVAAELTGAHGGPVKFIARDLSLPGTAVEIFDEIERASLHIDVLVNNAGFGVYGAFTETDVKAELDLLQVNIAALTQLTKLFLKQIRTEDEGRILNVASTAAFQPGPLMAVYYASKAYVLSFSEALANELRGSGVTVSALCPGPTRTGFRRRARMGVSRLFKRGVMDAATVAAVGYRGLMRGKTVIIPGLRNKLLAFSVRLAPRRLVPPIVRMLQARRAKPVVREP
jgi:short-subunit dehydrogenase